MCSSYLNTSIVSHHWRRVSTWNIWNSPTWQICLFSFIYLSFQLFIYISIDSWIFILYISLKPSTILLCCTNSSSSRNWEFFHLFLISPWHHSCYCVGALAMFCLFFVFSYILVYFILQSHQKQFFFGVWFLLLNNNIRSQELHAICDGCYGNIMGQSKKV